MIIKYLVTTEKAVGKIEFHNELVFAVETSATKASIKKEVETMYKVKVDKVRSFINPLGEKRAYVKINKEFSADDIAAKLKVV